MDRLPRAHVRSNYVAPSRSEARTRRRSCPARINLSEATIGGTRGISRLSSRLQSRELLDGGASERGGRGLVAPDEIAAGNHSRFAETAFSGATGKNVSDNGRGRAFTVRGAREHEKRRSKQRSPRSIPQRACRRAEVQRGLNEVINFQFSFGPYRPTRTMLLRAGRFPRLDRRRFFSARTCRLH